MLTAEKDGREVAAMIMNEAVNDVLGVVQCTIPGCQAYQVLMNDDPDDPKCASKQVYAFMMEHDCDPSRYPESELAERRAIRRSMRRSS